MNLLLLLVTIVVSAIAVRAGAIALELTGLERSIARFQSLSCFTGTGFTTKESESVTGHPQRRKIATVLMLIGHAGIVTMIATFANSLRPSSALSILLENITPSFVPVVLIPWLNLAVIVLALSILYRVFMNQKMIARLRGFLWPRLERIGVVQPTSVVVTSLLAQDIGVAQVYVGAGSCLQGRTLSQIGLGTGVDVLAIGRGGTGLRRPAVDTALVAGDTLVCFGDIGNVRDVVSRSSRAWGAVPAGGADGCQGRPD